MSPLSPERWARARALFEAAVDAPPAARSELLAAAASEDSEVAEEVRLLLEAHESPTEIGDADAAELREALEELDLERSLVGQRLGPWQVERRLGRGGMGDVFLAHRADGAYAGSVALKTIRLGMDSPEVVARFEAERQILARLAHPNIARLLDGGVSPDGRPYLVMDRVEGVPITEYAEAQDLPEERRLALFLDVCDAVRYAHRNLVVHRDIKPSNVLVTGEGRPVLLDFGIAKLLDPEVSPGAGAPEPTRTRHLTPEYASPEQQRGEPVTTASDVYMLGVVLRELLTGRREADPGASPRPRRLRGDLEVIVRVATQPDPARRYGSVEPLVEDVRRHLAGLPIHARADSRIYRAGKFLSRHRALAAAGALLVLTLLSAVLAVSWEAARAERNFADARALANALLFDVHDAIVDLPGSTPARRLLVQRALLYLDRLSSRAQDDPSLRIELARAYVKTANVLGNPGGPNLGDREGALAAFEKAAKIVHGLGPAADTRPGREAAWGLEFGLASMSYWASRYDEARGHRERAASLADRLLEENPGDAESLRRVASTAILAGDIEFWGGALDAALGHYRSALRAVESASAAAPGDPTLQLAVAGALTHLGESLDWAERYDEAGDALRRSVAIHDRLLRTEPGNARVENGAMLARARRAELLVAEGRSAEAIEVLLPAVRTGQDLLKFDPRNALAQNNLALVYSCLGAARCEAKQWDEARDSFGAALALREARSAADPTVPENRRAVATSLAQLADVERSRRRPADALALYDRSIAVLRLLHVSAPGDPSIDRDLATYLTSSGIVARALDPDRARSSFGEAAALWDGLEQRGQMKAYDRDSAATARSGATR
jgi:eukaryotic-like serine/threonine-protein kinase